MSASVPHGVVFARFIKSLAIGKGDPIAAEAYAQSQRAYFSTPDVVTAVKALTGALDTDAAQEALRIVQRDFAAYLRPLTIVGRLQGLRRVPFRTHLTRADQGTGAAWVGEGAPIPVSEMSLTDVADRLLPLKVGGIAVLTMELVRNSQPIADAVIAADVAAAIVQAMDAAFVDPQNTGIADEKPAAVTAGATSFESSGSTVAAIDADLKRLMDTLTDANRDLSTAAWTMAPKTASTLSLKRNGDGSPAYPGMTARGGTLCGLPVLTSKACEASGSPGERAISLIEASEIMLADDGAAELDVAGDASVQMNDAPSAGAQQLVSLWQNGLVGVRGIRMMNWQRRRSGAVAVLRSVAY